MNLFHLMEMSQYMLGDLAEPGRKVDLALCFDEIELGNVEFRSVCIGDKDVNVQRRKSVQLGRSLQEAHRQLGIKDPSVLMADVAGFVGVFYQIVPMDDIWVAGRTIYNPVQVPTDVGALQDILEEDDLLVQKFRFFASWFLSVCNYTR
ncbi:hypothetical protein BGX28_005672 [Mortierella sp. GBA30]|nr:hypothetical protein BGX28_005672 [Mortierella sp. GBA30]